MNRAVFLDRDGTVTKSPRLITKPEELMLEEKAAEGVRILNDAGMKVIVITNQPQIARGLCTEEDVKGINQKMVEKLKACGARIDAIYFCPHHPETHHTDVPDWARKYRIECKCRKPNIGMLKQAAEEFGIDLSNSFVIGDRTVDIQTGKNAGIKTILVKTGIAGLDGKYDVKADYESDNLLEAAKIISRKNINAVILAGGKGERLWPLTKDIPKPMIDISGRPVLEHQISMLKKYDINEVVVCGSYLVEKIKDYFGDGKDFGIKIYYPEEPEPLGSGGAIKNAAVFLDCSHFVVLSGDVMADINLGPIIDFHISKAALATMIVRQSDHPKDSDVVVMDSDNRITRYIGRGQDTHKISNTGIMIFSRNIIESIPEGVSNIEKDVVFRLLGKAKIYGYLSDGYIKDMGTFERLESVRKHFGLIS